MYGNIPVTCLSAFTKCVCFCSCACLLDRLASSRPLSTVCHFLACRANFKTCKENHREEEAGQVQIPLNWATVLRAFGRQTVNLPLALLRLRNLTSLLNQPTTDLFLHVTAVKDFHLKAFFKRKYIYYYYYYYYLLFILFAFWLLSMHIWLLNKSIRKTIDVQFETLCCV